MTEFADVSLFKVSILQLPFSFGHFFNSEFLLLNSRVQNTLLVSLLRKRRLIFLALCLDRLAIADNRSRKKADLVKLHTPCRASSTQHQSCVLWFSEWLDMALRARFCCFILLVALPTLGSCIRPFTVPKNLFVQGTSPLTLPEGARVIRREAREPDSESPQELVEDLHYRFRRDAPIPNPNPELSSVSF